MGFICQQIAERRVYVQVAAPPGERAPAQRSTHRNGECLRGFNARIDSLELRVAKPCEGSYFAGILGLDSWARRWPGARRLAR